MSGEAFVPAQSLKNQIWQVWLVNGQFVITKWTDVSLPSAYKTPVFLCLILHSYLILLAGLSIVPPKFLLNISCFHLKSLVEVWCRGLCGHQKRFRSLILTSFDFLFLDAPLVLGKFGIKLGMACAAEPKCSHSSININLKAPWKTIQTFLTHSYEALVLVYFPDRYNQRNPLMNFIWMPSVHLYNSKQRHCTISI